MSAAIVNPAAARNALADRLGRMNAQEVVTTITQLPTVVENLSTSIASLEALAGRASMIAALEAVIKARCAGADVHALPIGSIVLDVEGDEWKREGDGWHLRLADEERFAGYATAADVLNGDTDGDDGYGPFTLVRFGPADE